MSGTYNEVLVLFSLLVAILASYTALDMASRVTTTQGTSAARWWLAGGAMAMGLGIWSMHFVGMLAFDLPIPLGYDLAITLYSMLAAVGVSAFALWLVSRPDLPMRLLCLGAVLVLPLGFPLNWWKSPCIRMATRCASAGSRWKHRHPLPPTLW